MRLTFAVPGDPATRTGGTLYDRRLADELAALGWTVEWLRLPDGFPLAAPGEIDAAVDALLGAAPGLVMVDGLALGALPADRLLPLVDRLVALVHHPLAYETGLGPADARRLAETETAVLARTRAVVVTSQATAALLHSTFAVPESHITIAEPGTDPAPRARGGGGEVLEFTALGTLSPRKGQDLLVAALASLKDRPWRCRIAGSAEREPAFAARLREAVAEAGLDGRVLFLGEIDEAARDRLLDETDVFVLPSRFEGYGMVFAEALARGLPVVAAAAGPVATLVPQDAGRLVPPEDAGALAEALARLTDRPDERLACADGAWKAAETLPRWPDSAARVDAALRRVLDA